MLLLDQVPRVAVGTMTSRVCHVLVLSPQARSRDQAAEYRPFGGKTLSSILRYVAASVSQSASRQHDEHAVFDEFHFWKTGSDEMLSAELRNRVSVLLVDCRIYSDSHGESGTGSQTRSQR